MAGWWTIGTTDHPLYKVATGLAATARFGSLGAFGLALKAGGALSSGTFNALTRESDYGSNVMGRNLMPPLEDLLNLHYSRVLSVDELAQAAKYHGVDFSARGVWSQYRADLWDKVRASRKPHYPPEMLRRWARQDVAGASTELGQVLVREGYATRAEQDWFTEAWEPLSPDTIIYLYWLGVISNVADYHSLMWQHGIRGNEADQMLQAAEAKPQVGAVLDLFNKGVLTEREARDGLAANGWTLEAGKDLILKTRFEPPSVGGLYQLAGQNTWNDVFAGKWGLDDDKPQQLGTWAQRLGLQHTTDPTKPYGDQTGQTWSDALWRGHWQTPDMGLLAQIIHRFRGDPDDSSTWSQPGYPPLRQSEIWDAMRAAGLPTLSRNYLGRLVYVPMSLRHIRILIKNGGYGPLEVAGALMDNGYSPVDAQRLAPAIIADTLHPITTPVDALTRRTYNKLVAGIESAYGVGALSHDQAGAELVGLGLPQSLATNMLASVDLEVNTAIVKRVTARAKGDVFSGRTTLAGAKDRLLSAGMDPARVAQVVASWQAEFGEGRRHLATEQVQKYLRKGFIGRAEAVRRLANIGWAAPDALILLQDVQAEMASDQAKVVKAAAASKTKEQAAIGKTLKKLAGQANSLISRLHTITPVGEIKAWVKAGTWTDARATDQLRLMGYPDDVIADMLKTAHAGKSAKSGSGAKSTSKAAKPPQTGA